MQLLLRNQLMKKHNWRTVATIVLLFALIHKVSAQDYRDVVFLKNGTVIKGFYNELFPGDSLRMETIDGGVLICAMSDIARIAKERTSLYVVNIQDEASMPKRIWRPQGYRGFIEYGQETNLDDSGLKMSSLMTVHGYQFNRHVFLGVGFGLQNVEYSTNGFKLSFDRRVIPVFGDVQLSVLKTRITPLVDCRIGYSISGLKGTYFNPSVGVDFGISPRFGGYILLGYSQQKYKDEDDNTNKKLKALSLHCGLHF